MKQAFDGVSGRLHCAVGLMHKVTVRTTFKKPFKWTYGDDLDFEGDIPKDEVKPAPGAETVQTSVV